MQTQTGNPEYSDEFRQPTHFTADFITDGATDPSEFGGHVESVLRLETADPRPFFRVRFKELIPNLSSLRTCITTGVEADENIDATVKFSTAGYTADPADVIEDDRELDVQLMIAGVAADTAGVRINLAILIDQGEDNS
jgi:hypothetical protein